MNSLKKVKDSLKRVGLITLVTTIFSGFSGFSPVRSQNLETKLFEEKTINLPVSVKSSLSHLDIVYKEDNGIVYGPSYDINNDDNELLFENRLVLNSELSDKTEEEKKREWVRERLVPYDKPLEISWWGKLKTIDIGWGTPTSLFGPYEGKVIELVFSIPYLPTFFGVGTVLSEGNYGENRVGSILPVYIEFPLYMQLALPKSERIYKTEDGQLIMHYDYIGQGGVWTHANVAASFFIGGSKWGASEMGIAKKAFEYMFSGYIDAKDPAFGIKEYLHSGINLTLFLPAPPPLVSSMTIEGGILLKEPNKLEDSIYASFSMSVGSVMWARLK